MWPNFNTIKPPYIDGCRCICWACRCFAIVVLASIAAACYPLLSVAGPSLRHMHAHLYPLCRLTMPVPDAGSPVHVCCRRQVSAANPTSICCWLASICCRRRLSGVDHPGMRICCRRTGVPEASSTSICCRPTSYLCIDMHIYGADDCVVGTPYMWPN